MIDVAQELAQRLPFWDQLSPKQQDMLARSTREVTYEAKAHVHNGSDDCEGIIVMLSGSLRAYMLSPKTGKEITLFRVGSRESCVLAASSILSMITFDIFLDAVEPTHILAINADAFSQVMHESSAVEAFCYRQTAERFSEVMWVMQQVIFASFDSRLALFLLDERSRTGSDRLKITHAEIARHLGSAREVVSRMLKYFQDEGMVELARETIVITDVPRLRELAQQAV